MSSHSRAGGMVLLVSLLFLILVALLALTMLRTNTLQMTMASNAEHSLEARQRALAIVDSILDASIGAPRTEKLGYRQCAVDADPVSPACDEYVVRLSHDFLLDPDSGAEVEYYLERVAPLEAAMPFRREEVVSSATVFAAIHQEITVVFDRTRQGRGISHLSQGYLRLVPNPPSTHWQRD